MIDTSLRVEEPFELLPFHSTNDRQTVKIISCANATTFEQWLCFYMHEVNVWSLRNSLFNTSLEREGVDLPFQLHQKLVLYIVRYKDSCVACNRMIVCAQSDTRRLSIDYPAAHYKVIFSVLR